MERITFPAIWLPSSSQIINPDIVDMHMIALMVVIDLLPCIGTQQSNRAAIYGNGFPWKNLMDHWQTLESVQMILSRDTWRPRALSNFEIQLTLAEFNRLDIILPFSDVKFYRYRQLFGTWIFISWCGYE